MTIPKYTKRTKKQFPNTCNIPEEPRCSPFASVKQRYFDCQNSRLIRLSYRIPRSISRIDEKSKEASFRSVLTAEVGWKVKSGKGQSWIPLPNRHARCTFGSFRAVSGRSLPRVTCLPRLLIEGGERSVFAGERRAASGKLGDDRGSRGFLSSCHRAEGQSRAKRVAQGETERSRIFAREPTGQR